MATENVPAEALDQPTAAGSELVPDSSANDRASATVLSGLNRLPIVRQIALMVIAALVVGLVVVAFLWSGEPNYKPLINRLQDYNTSDIVEVLQREGIDFQVDPSSQVLLVKSGDLHKARLKLAAVSLLDDKSVGLEVLERDSSLGTSQFIENARYRRGLEGELARTITSVRSIRHARVHLALPQQSVFVRDNRKPRASVFVELFHGDGLSRDQVEAIINLVASSVSEMDKSDVSVVDQHGNLLSKPEEKTQDLLATQQLEYSNRVQDNLNRAVVDILSPVLGRDNFQAQVAADIDFTEHEQTQELYNPDLIALRSEQTLHEEKTDEIEGGIPGALSNQPPVEAFAPEQALGAGQAAGQPTTTRSEATRNYEVDRTLSYQKQQSGQIRRLTVGVVVNDRPRVTENGSVEFVPWSENDLLRLELLVKDAVGFNAARGDSVSVINSPFVGIEPEPVEGPFWSTPWFWDIVKQALAGLFILILIFGVIRPTLRSLRDRGRDEASVLLEELEDAEAGLDEDQVTLAGLDDYLLPGASDSYERQLDALRGLIAEDPARVAQVVIRWVNEDHGK